MQVAELAACTSRTVLSLMDGAKTPQGGVIVLVLTRKDGESIQIGEDVQIVLRKVSGRVRKFIVLAPAYIRVLRSELLEADEVEQPADSEIPETLEEAAVRYTSDPKTLVISRSPEESILLFGLSESPVRVTLLSPAGGRNRIGLDGPQEVRFSRPAKAA